MPSSAIVLDINNIRYRRYTPYIRAYIHTEITVLLHGAVLCPVLHLFSVVYRGLERGGGLAGTCLFFSSSVDVAVAGVCTPMDELYVAVPSGVYSSQ